MDKSQMREMTWPKGFRITNLNYDYTNQNHGIVYINPGSYDNAATLQINLHLYFKYSIKVLNWI